MITPRLARETERSILVPIIIDVEPTKVERVTGFLQGVVSPYQTRGALGKAVQTFGAPEIVDAYLMKGFVHDIQLPTTRLISTYSTRETIAELDGLDGVKALHYDTVKSAPPILPYMPSFGPTPLGAPISGEEAAQGWFGTHDVHEPLGVDVAHQEGYTADSIKIAVIDTGVHRQHRQLLGSNVRASSVLPILRLLERAVGDSSGHGSWCVTCINGGLREVTGGIMAHGLTKAEVLSIRALFTPLGTGRDSDILKAMSMAYEAGVHIISMSLGGECEGDDCPLCAAVRELSDANIVLCIAAGNEGLPDSVACPGKEPAAVTVGSVSLIDRSVSYFSSRGEAVDCVLFGGGRGSADSKPAEYIYSGVSPYSMLDTLIDHALNGYGLLAGTSMATPQMAALVALWDDYYYKAKGYYLTPVDVHDILRQDGRVHTVEDGYGQPKFDWIKDYV